MTPALRIQARPAAGIRRCGVRHPAEAVDHPPGAFTSGQVATLLRDPDLVVEVIAATEEGAAVDLLDVEIRVPIADLRGPVMPAVPVTDVPPAAIEGAAAGGTGEAGADGAPASSSDPAPTAAPAARARKAKD